ncbi:hypothetical protein C488_02011 [Natrinema pellirubrum DSM 15624]|uniref:Small CPxCG-related zinc finger protein n=1 Tax=Natrinema pellirubrum (strain DSM 15624 / CIP 106293 / JCM 10476 / NCIMB 786 / 157) TaxID=797303 RepID=L0JKI1_NATP1|nr:hypothetical protein [Natrinema pellirubrum]AGB31092.1 hypothetical protein Natpe_1185 [Natrinema pellirubrum DSM 15624]ELY81066.1 hypothetical protein C488_02011 [Natrinema pellirubrum DSM 15624]
MPECQHCGAFVTRDFVRVFGVDGEVRECPACSTYREITAAPNDRDGGSE